MKRKGNSYTKALLNADKVLTPEAYRIYKLNSLVNYTASLGINSGELAGDFLKSNPELNRSYSGKFLENVLIPRVEEFNKLADKDFADDVTILDEEKEITSFNELLDSLKGKPFLLDYWGTWCTVCGYQFKFNDKIKPFLKNNGIEMVYIAYEYDLSPAQREQWKNYIKAYNLTGYHLISNKSLKEDIEQQGGEIEGFPTYMIVGSDGKILESNACRPENSEKLISQLKDKIKSRYDK